jgi:hypothetical protein
MGYNFKIISQLEVVYYDCQTGNGHQLASYCISILLDAKIKASWQTVHIQVYHCFD